MIEQDEETCDALVGNSQVLQLCCDTITPRKGNEAAGEVELLASEVLAMALQVSVAGVQVDARAPNLMQRLQRVPLRQMMMMTTTMMVPLALHRQTKSATCTSWRRCKWLPVALNAFCVAHTACQSCCDSRQGPQSRRVRHGRRSGVQRG